MNRVSTMKDRWKSPKSQVLKFNRFYTELPNVLIKYWLCCVPDCVTDCLCDSNQIQ